MDNFWNYVVIIFLILVITWSFTGVYIELKNINNPALARPVVPDEWVSQGFSGSDLNSYPTYVDFNMLIVGEPVAGIEIRNKGEYELLQGTQVILTSVDLNDIVYEFDGNNWMVKKE